MSGINVEAVTRALFAHPGVKAVDDLRLYATGTGDLGVAAKMTLAAGVDLAVVRATAAIVVAEQFGICEVDLRFNDPGPPPMMAPGGPLEKK